MNENEFARSILTRVLNDDTLHGWYTSHLRGQGLDRTVETFANSMLSKEQVAILAIFIGLTTWFRSNPQ